MKILIVDDSSLYRKLMSMAVEGLDMTTDVDTAPSGQIALKKIPTFLPDLVLLDIEMPDMNGIEVLREIRREYPQITVILVSGANSRSADITIEGLTSGAAHFIPKPISNNMEEGTRELRAGLLEAFNLLEAKLKTRAGRTAQRDGGTPAASPAATQPMSQVGDPKRKLPNILPTRVNVVAIGVSTGGPVALEKLLPALPGNLPVPVVIVQHMPPVFTESLAKALDKKSAITVHEAADGQVLEPGHAYIAKGGVHLMIKKQIDQEAQKLVCGLVDSEPVNSCKPAVDVLFESLGRVAGPNTLAVVMTGMGSDGCDGARSVKNANGYVLSQSADSCTVYGMPQAVDQAGLSDESVHLDQLANRITEIILGGIR